MARYLSTFASVLSLLLCAATLVLWVRSYPRIPPPLNKSGWSFYSAGHRVNARVERGVLLLQMEEGYRIPSGGFHSPPGKVYSTDSWGTEVRSWLGTFGYWHSYPRYAFQLMLFCPVWWLTLLLAILPSAWLWRWLRLRGRIAYGRCMQCGYDLRASRDRCPECGAAVPAETEAGA